MASASDGSDKYPEEKSIDFPTFKEITSTINYNWSNSKMAKRN